MKALKNKLNELIEEYGLRHEKVLAYSQELDRYIALEQFTLGKITLDEVMKFLK